MMYPRLKLAKNLLSDDGVIFISIDDNEVNTLRNICDDIFSHKNFIGEIVLQTATDNNPRQISTEHEYIVCYSKNKNIQQPWQSDNDKAKLIQHKYVELKNKYGEDIEKIQKDLRIWIKKNESILKGVSHYDNVDEKGVFHDGDIANTVFGGYKYDIIHPITGKICKIPDKGFRFAENTMKYMIENNDIMFGKNENVLIKPKKRIENAKDILRSVIYEDGRSSTKKFESIMSRDIFQNTKSSTVLSRLIKFIAKDDDIILDFFSGSATTMEAIMETNSEKNYSLKGIMVQIEENLDESLKTVDQKGKKTISNAIKFLDNIKKPHTICEIGKERIRRAGKKIKDENPLTTTDLDTGFRVLRLDSSNMKEVFYKPEEFTQENIALFADNVKADRTDEDLLFQTMLSHKIELSVKIEELTLAGKKAFSVDDGYLIACFDKDITIDTIEAIAKRKPVYAVVRDASFNGDSTAENFEQIFRQFSPDTVRKVI